MDSLDQGKPIREAAADIGDAISACAHFAMLAEKQDSEQNEVIENGDPDFETTIVLEPIGVVAAITPWNYPLLMAVWKVIPAIAAGCCVVLKPSELAPLSCLLLAEMFTEVIHTLILVLKCFTHDALFGSRRLVYPQVP